MVEPFQDLVREHHLIGRVLSVLERSAQRILTDQVVPVDTLSDAIGFLEQFAASSHHPKEEGALFPLLASKPGISAHGALLTLATDHIFGRSRIQNLRKVFPLTGSSSADRSTFGGLLSACALETRHHLSREAQIVFPLARASLNGSELTWLASAFAKIEQHSETNVSEYSMAAVARIEALFEAETLLRSHSR